MAFQPSELKKFIEDELGKSIVPSGHRGAFVAVLDDHGVKTAIAVKTKDGWEVQGIIGFHPHEGGLETGVNVLKTW